MKSNNHVILNQLIKKIMLKESRKMNETFQSSKFIREKCTSKSHGSRNDFLYLIRGQARVWGFGNFHRKHCQIGFSLGIPYLVQPKTNALITVTERHHNLFNAFVISRMGLTKFSSKNWYYISMVDILRCHKTWDTWKSNLKWPSWNFNYSTTF